MEDITGLLVAFMFITILSMGVASTLTELAEVVRGADGGERHRLAIGWTLLLLFAHFLLFWQTADLMLIEQWGFWLFVFAEVGPVLLLLSTQVIVGTFQAQGMDAPVLQRRFLALFGALQVWSIAASFIIGEGLSAGRTLDLVVLLTCVVLSFTTKRRMHTLGLLTVWGAYLLNGALLQLASNIP